MYKKYRNISLKIIILIAVIWGMVSYGRSIWDPDLLSNISFAPSLVLLAMLLYLIHYLGKYFIWYLLTVRFRLSIDAFKTINIRSIGEVGKYIPGKVWSYLYLFKVYENSGYSRVQITKALYYDMFCQVAASFTLGLFIMVVRPDIFFFFPKWILSTWFILGVYLLLILGLNQRLINGILRFVFRLDNNEVIAVRHRDLYLIKNLYLLNFISFLFGTYFLILSLGIDSIFMLDGILIASVYIGASVIGLFAFFVPGGIGVREGVFIFILSGLYQNSEVLLIALLLRLGLMVVEVILLFITYGFRLFFEDGFNLRNNLPG